MGKNSTSLKRVRLPTPAQLIRSDLECETRTNLPINHCAEMLAQTLRSEAGLSAQPQLVPKNKKVTIEARTNQCLSEGNSFTFVEFWPIPKKIDQEQVPVCLSTY